MSFALDISKFKAKTDSKLLLGIKKVSLGLSSDIIKDTPVDKGRLRSAWIPDINKFSISNPTTIEKNENAIIGKAIQESNKIELGDTFTLTNNVSYSKKIEYGGSPKKAPDGMVRINVIRWQTKINSMFKG